MTENFINQELQELRKTIDNCDAVLIHILAERFRCTEKVGLLKAKYNLNSFDENRENSQKQKIAALAQNAGLNVDLAQKFMQIIRDETVKNHENIKKNMGVASASL